jgi:hypothetical protein
MEFSEVLMDKQTPLEVRTALVEMLLTKQDPAWAGQFVTILPQLAPQSPLRAKILDWLARHPGPAVLDEVVKIWAAQKATGPDENNYMEMISRLSSKPWDKALLETMNSPECSSGPWAMQILCARMSMPALRERIQSLQAQTSGMRATQAFLKQFDYLPATPIEFQAMTAIYTAHPDSLNAAAKTYRQWQGQGYVFNIRDYHLLDKFGSESARKMMTREQLVKAIQQHLQAVEHIHVKASPATTKPLADDVASNLDRLTMGDLWNVCLLAEMLSRPRTQAALRVVARQDMEDTKAARGGLVFFRAGEADAMLYRESPDAGENDLTYIVSSKAFSDGLESLCRFAAHFEKDENAGRAGPTAQELTVAADDNCYGVIFTSVSAKTFCAHYYNPRGVVISLGAYPFQTWK